MEFKKFFDALPLGVFVVDAQGRPLYANLATIDLLGKGLWPEAAIEQLNDIYQAYQTGTNQLYPLTEQPLLKALQGEACRVDDLEIRQGGQIIPLEVTGTPIFDDQGQLQYAMVVLRDLRDRQRRSQQQISLQQDLLRRNQGLTQENATLKRKLADLEAELNSQQTQ
ncbi:MULTISPECIES: PAS domain-containing protein [unclassified Synechocystis]|uniref:PAS domain-containing protein n=1 Tax=unclassified Synechocystis TaxID=2640012 RepID=UPI000425F671|nr:MULTISPECIES: PAS domain-containing protein [unclassified Synechocystis]AIE73480.1 putative PAS/PAC sensor protein [Synechocystis sp. PCC 6714]MCT0254167.1 PAS domain-containing protein [Synechocystis sp. CS-94]